MEKKFRITVEGKPYVVTVEDITADAQNIYQDTAAAVLSAAPFRQARICFRQSVWRKRCGCCG
ncbi:hypothetical protein, partial [Candidatus Contendibacter odensensis]|uniref:hypothetical protein n=1 Tax=Candidatus Contendibacter odensensis TaxID=1400860 RepID=UPI000551B3BF